MKKIAMYGLGIAGLAAAGFAVAPSLASAQSAIGSMSGGKNGSGYEQMIQTKAKIVGVDAAELKTQLQTKTMLQLAEENGVSKDQLQEAIKDAARQRWAEKGLSQSEVETRLKNMEERQAGDHESNSANRGAGMRHGRFNQ